jgi:serine/threonine protein kinase
MPTKDGDRVVSGRYALGARLGSGGMGTVWHGRDQLLDREVAVKQIHIPESVSKEERDAIEGRVLREARAAAQLNHVGAVAVYDVTQESGQAFIVMELVTAPSLADLVKSEGPLTPRRAAEIGLQVLGALEAAHAKGIVHRDVKPANVMVTDEGVVKLADFGIASLVDDPRLTSTGLILGSPAYMAPEQAHEQESGPATDLWGLGATLYYAICGRPPFEKPNPIATLTSVVNDPVDMPPEAGELATVIEALLAKDPVQRPETGALKRSLAHAAGLGADVGTQPLQRHPTDTQVIETPVPIAPAPEPVPQPDPTPAPVPRPEPVQAPVADQPPPTTPGPEEDYDDYESPSKRPWWIVAVAALAAATLLLFMMLNQSDDPGGRENRAGSGTATTEAATEDTTPDEEESSDPGEVPADWETYSDDATGFEITYPPGWQVSDPGSSNSTDFTDPETGSYLRVDWRSPPGDDAAAAWEASSDAFGAAHENYQEIRIDPTTYNGWEAAEWEYTYSDGGADLHAINLGFIVDDEYGFALNFQTHEEDWAASQELFETLKASFQAPQ